MPVEPKQKTDQTGNPIPPLVITIDGPAGAGKTTVSKILAAKLDYRYIDTGALYRAVALAAKTSGIAPDDDTALEWLCRKLDLDLVQSDAGLRVWSDGQDVTDQLRTPEITMMASAVSARPGVRQFLLSVQRKLGQGRRVVCEGRDMGTVVFPDAEVKFFLDASLNTRANRRFLEMPAESGQGLEDVASQMRKRDQNDSQRTIAPLKAADDAVIINSDRLTIDEVVAAMLERIRQRY